MALITLSWNPPQAGQGGPVEKYQVYRMLSDSTSSNPSASTIIGDGNSPIAEVTVDLAKEASNGEYEYRDESLSSAGGTQEYYWTVRATNNGGSSAGAPPVMQTL